MDLPDVPSFQTCLQKRGRLEGRASEVKEDATIPVSIFSKKELFTGKWIKAVTERHKELLRYLLRWGFQDTLGNMLSFSTKSIP